MSSVTGISLSGSASSSARGRRTQHFPWGRVIFLGEADERRNRGKGGGGAHEGNTINWNPQPRFGSCGLNFANTSQP
uniref:Uncharacterized protein n=1 Tax=Setaria italica TaxID=4555 RepID=K3YBC2_SETIT